MAAAACSTIAAFCYVRGYIFCYGVVHLSFRRLKTSDERLLLGSQARVASVSSGSIAAGRRVDDASIGRS